MGNKTSISIALIGILLLASVLGCMNKNDIVYENNAIDALSSINIEIIEKEVVESGIEYVAILKNDSPFLIAQNDVYLSFPIIISNGKIFNNFKIRGENNHLNIQKGEQVKLKFFAPREMYQNNEFIDIETPIFEILGYFKDVRTENRFHTTLPTGE